MTKSTKRGRSTNEIVRDYALYFLIIFAFGGLSFAFMSVWGQNAYIRWGGLIGFTAGLFVYFVNDSRQYFREWRFWKLTAILLVVHIAGFYILLTHVGEWKVIWFTGMVFEYPVFTFFRSSLPYSSS